MRRLFRLGLWLGVFIGAGYVIARVMKAQQDAEAARSDGWSAVPPTRLEPVAMATTPRGAGEAAPATEVDAPVVVPDEVAADTPPAPTKKAAPPKKAAAKKASPAKKTAAKKAAAKKAAPPDADPPSTE